MVRRDGAAIKKERIQEMAKAIQKKLHSEGEIPLNKTVAFFEYDLGLTKSRILEYLKALEELGQFVLDTERDRISKVTGVEETSNE